MTFFLIFLKRILEICWKFPVYSVCSHKTTSLDFAIKEYRIDIFNYLMNFVYGKAPVYINDKGLPGYLDGEWPGHKSNKFERTRRIIIPQTQGIIFNGIDLLNR